MALTIPDQTIAAQVKVPDAMNTLSSIMNIRNAQQQNQILQTQNSATAADLREKTALRDLANAPGMWNSDGTFNRPKFASIAPGVAATLGPAVAQGNLTNESTQIANQTNRFNLQKDQFAHSMQLAGGLLQDPNVIAASDPSVAGDPSKSSEASKGIMQSLSDTEDQMVQAGVPKLTARGMLAPLYTAAVHNPAQVRPMLATIVQKGLSAQGQASQSLVTAGGQQEMGQDANGNPTVIQRDQFGNIQGVRSAPVQGQAPSAAPFFIPPGETQQTVSELQQRRGAVNQAAAQVPDQHYNNRQIIGILDKDQGNAFSPTGSNASFIAHLSGMIGVPISGDFATDAQKISHFLALQTQSNEKAMGVSTDAGRLTSEIAAGSIKQTPSSLRTAVEINDAGSTGLDFFNRGMETAVKQGGVGAVRQFQNAWSQNYDPNAMRLHNAKQNGDTKEADEVVKDLGGKDSPKFKAMIQKARNIELLSTQGHL